MSVSVGKSSIVSSNLVLYLDPSSPVNYTINEVEVLVVAGGGGGGGRHAGGGGGGGVIYVNSYAVTPGTPITATVGNGGSGGGYGGRGGNGQNSVFGNLTAIGGGGGGGYDNGNPTVIGASGGSGGGGAGAAGLPGGNGSGGAGTAGQGNRGGDPWASGWPGGGGGGAGAPGQSPRNGLYGGRGGDGLLYNISGTPRYYGGGGGGGGEGNVDLNGALGGLGGGGRSTGAFNPTQGQAGQANTGGGGGGSRDAPGAVGGSGVVIVRYPGPQKATGGNTITQVGGYTIHTFTSSGTFTPLTQAQLQSTPYGLQDLSGNGNHFTLFNSPTLSTSGGFINFDGTNQYARSSSTLDLSPFNAVTVEICLRVNTTNSPSGMAFEHSSDWNSQSMGFGLVPNSTGGLTYTANTHHTNQLNGERFDFDGTIGTDIVLFTLIRSRVPSGTGRLAYINAVQRNVLSGSTATTSYPSFRNDFFYISSRAGSSIFANHRVYFVRIYGRALSSTEISQNFNAQRGRFGI